MASIKLGDLLVKANVLKDEQLKAALNEQRRWGGKLGEVLLRMGFVTEEVMVKALSRQLAVPAADVDKVVSLPPEVQQKIPLETARELSVLPLTLRDDGRTLVVALADPSNSQQLQRLRVLTGCRIFVQIAGKTALGRALARLYDQDEASELSQMSGSFKMVDAQGRTVVREALPEPSPSSASPVAAVVAARPAPSKPAPATAPSNKAPAPVQVPLSSAGVIPASRPPGAGGASGGGLDTLELVRTLEQAQRRDVAALKAVVELLIEKGYFTREEYVAKLKRAGA